MSETTVVDQDVEVTAPAGAEIADAVEKTDALPPGEQEEAVASDDENQEPEKAKRRSRAEERINELTREKYEAQRQMQALQMQLQEIQARQQPAQLSPDEPMPRIDQYGYDEDRYQAAVQQWHQKQVNQLQQRQQMERQQQAYHAEMTRQQQVLMQKTQEGMAKYPDFVQKVNDPRLPLLREVNPVAFQAVLESDATADVAYYLASNPQEIYRFASMTPTQAVREVTLLEIKLRATPPKQVKTPPKPPSTVSGSGSEAAQDPDRMSTAEWLEWRNRQIQPRR